MQYLKMNTGASIPMLGLGVFRVPEKDICKQSVKDAITAGYTLIDTAAVYGNEDAVGEAVRESIAEGVCKREDLFITSKVWVTDMNDYDSVRKAVDASLKKAGLEYFDLHLLHQACNDYFAAWRGLEGAYADGQVKAIGVSNFYPHTLTNFCETVKIVPAVNQIELHPYYVQPLALETMKYYGVVPEAWAPLGGGRYEIFTEKVILEIAEKYGKTAGQVVLRWNVDRGVVVIPKSVHKERIEENFDIWDFQLTREEVEKIAQLDMGYTGTRAKHYDPDFVRMVLGKN